MSEMTARLERGRNVAWDSLKPAFDHAIALAREDEYRAAVASDAVHSGVAPAYSPLVTMLAESVKPAPIEVPIEVPF